MAIVGVWLALCMVAALIAKNKGRSGLGFFLLAFFLSPLVGLIAAAFAKPNRQMVEQQQVQSGELRKCPFCAELVKAEALIVATVGASYRGYRRS